MLCKIFERLVPKNYLKEFVVAQIYLKEFVVAQINTLFTVFGL